MRTVFIFLIAGLFLFNACSKDSDPTPTPVVKTIEVLLTQRTWKADEARIQLSNNTTQYYKRGAVGNTVNYDSDSIKFSTNNTGNYYFNGTITPITWNFVNTEKTKMTVILNYTPTPVTLNWENVFAGETSLRYAQYATGGSPTYLASVSRVPN